MTRIGSFVAAIGLIGLTLAWLSATRAADEPLALSQGDQIAQLLSRVEKLEKRIAVLEADKERATRQVNAAFEPVDPRRSREPGEVRLFMHLKNGLPE